MHHEWDSEGGMSKIIDKAVAILNEKLGPEGFDGSAKLVFEGEGALIVDATGARASDGDADVTLTASSDVFEAMFAGEQNPTTAFMSGKLAIDGNMGQALKLSAIL